MNDSWVGLALPFGMIGFWFVVGIVGLVRMPSQPRGSRPALTRTNAGLGNAQTLR